MEGLAYLYLALNYERLTKTEFDTKLEQTEDHVLQTEINNEDLSIVFSHQTQSNQKFVLNSKLKFLITMKPIALTLVFILSSPASALLVRDSSGKEVTTLQNNLKQLGYFPRKSLATGYFGKVTEASVYKFQKDNGLIADGQVGVNTRNSLNKVLHPSHKNIKPHTSILQLGSKGEQVAELHYRLKMLEYFNDTSKIRSNSKDITFDRETEKSVKEFQQDNNLKVDGIVGQKTNEALFEAIWPSRMSGRALFNRGLERGNFSDALVDYNEAIKRDKNLVEAYYRRGMLYAYAGINSAAAADINRDINKALNNFTEAIKINPDYVEAYLERGIIYNEQKDWKRAIDDWTQVILIEPDNTEAYYRRAQAQAQLKNIRDTINDYIKIIQIQLKSEQDTDLKKQIEQIIDNFQNNQINPELMLALSQGIASTSAADFFLRREEYGSYDPDKDVKPLHQEAIKGLKNAINNLKNTKSQNNLTLLYYYEFLNQLLLDKFNTQIDTNQNTFVSNHYYKGILFLEKGKQQEAKNEFDKAIERQPNFTKAYYLRGIIRSKQGDNQGAINDFKKYLQGDPERKEAKKMRDYPNSNSLISEAQEVCFRQEIPQEYLETLESSVPSDAPAYLRRGKLRFLLGDYPGAKNDFQAAIKADSKLSAEAYYQIARVAAYEFYSLIEQPKPDFQQAFKQAKEAKDNFDEAIKISPDFSEAYFERGYLKYKITIKSNENNGSDDEIKARRNIRDTIFSKTTDDVDWLKDSQNDFQRSIKIDKNFALAYYLIVVAERYKSRIQNKQQTDDIVNYKLSSTEINNLTEAIRSDIYFYSEFIGQGRLIIKRAIYVDLENSQQDNKIKPMKITSLNFKKENGYYNLALENYRKKEYKQAIDNISKAIKLNPDITDYYVIRGAAYYFLKPDNEYNKKALNDFETSITLKSRPTMSISTVPPDAVPNITDSSSISNFLIGRILENQDISQKYYLTALLSLPQVDWIIDKQQGGTDQAQKVKTSGGAQVSSSCQCSK
ncbi:TPR repeat-containing protein (plasmid) [Calothrix brevissima NIES-22]|nr:TPR repeat-containing protein [Calothrix brevissima NIES-22]